MAEFTEPTDPGVGVLTEKQAAKYLGLAPITLKRMRKDGRGPRFVRLTTKRLGYRKASLDEWATERETTA